MTFGHAYRKPRVYWRYYPTVRRGYWMVDYMPPKATDTERKLWRAAHKAVVRVNGAVLLEDQA